MCGVCACVYAYVCKRVHECARGHAPGLPSLHLPSTACCWRFAVGALLLALAARHKFSSPCTHHSLTLLPLTSSLPQIIRRPSQYPRHLAILPLSMLLLLLGSAPAVGQSSTTTLAGSGTTGNTPGVGVAARFSAPKGIAISPSGDFALVQSQRHRTPTPAGDPPQPHGASQVQTSTLAGCDLASTHGMTEAAELPAAALTAIDDMALRCHFLEGFQARSSKGLGGFRARSSKDPEGFRATVSDETSSSVQRIETMRGATKDECNAEAATCPAKLATCFDETESVHSASYLTGYLKAHHHHQRIATQGRHELSFALGVALCVALALAALGGSSAALASSPVRDRGSHLHGIRRLSLALPVLLLLCPVPVSTLSPSPGPPPSPPPSPPPPSPPPVALQQPVTTVAGSTIGSTDGAGAMAKFSRPDDIALSPDGTFALVADANNDRIRHVDVGRGTVTTLFIGGLSWKPLAICMTNNGRYAFVLDQQRQKLKRIDIGDALEHPNEAIQDIAGFAAGLSSHDGAGMGANFGNPLGIVGTADGSTLYITEFAGCRVRRVDVVTHAVTTFAGQVNPGNTGVNSMSLGIIQGDTDGVGTVARFRHPRGITLSADESTLYVVEFLGYRIRRIDIATRTVTTFAGSGTRGTADGVGVAAQFYGPKGVALMDGLLFVTDATAGSSSVIRQVNIATGAVTTVAGTGVRGGADGAANAATFDSLSGIAAAHDGQLLLVTDIGSLGGNRIRRVLPLAGGTSYPLRVAPPTPPPPSPYMITFNRMLTRPGTPHHNKGGISMESENRNYIYIRPGGFVARQGHVHSAEPNYPSSGHPTDGGYSRVYGTPQAWIAVKSNGELSCWGLAVYGGATNVCPNAACATPGCIANGVATSYPRPIECVPALLLLA